MKRTKNRKIEFFICELPFFAMGVWVEMGSIFFALAECILCLDAT